MTNDTDYMETDEESPVHDEESFVTEEDAASPDDIDEGVESDTETLLSEVEARYQRKLDNVVGNLSQSIKKIEESLSRGSSDDKPSPLTDQEQAVFDRAIESSETFRRLQRQAETKAEEKAQELYLREYRSKWQGKIDDLRAEVGKGYTASDHERVVKLLDVGLEEEAERIHKAVRLRVKRQKTQKDETRRKAGTTTASRRGAPQPTYKHGSKATDRHARAEEIARNASR